MKNVLIALVLTMDLFFTSTISYSQTKPDEVSEQQKETLQKADQPKSIQEDTGNELGLIYSSKKLEEASLLIQKESWQDAENYCLQSKNGLPMSQNITINCFKY